MLSVARACFRLQGFPPADQIADSGDRKGSSEAGIEARKEFRGDSGDKLEGNSKPHHKKDEDITPEVEKGKKRFLAFRKTEDAFCVTLFQKKSRRLAGRMDFSFLLFLKELLDASFYVLHVGSGFKPCHHVSFSVDDELGEIPLDIRLLGPVGVHGGELLF